MSMPLILLTLASWMVLASMVALVDAKRPVVPVRTVRRVRTDVPHLLYCYLWADTAQPCYYGVSNEPPARHRRHEIDPNDRWWFQRSTGVMVPIAWLPNRAAAFAAERSAVREGVAAGEDLANQTHHPDGRFRRAVVR